MTLHGVPVSPGVASGPVVRLGEPSATAVAEPPNGPPPQDRDVEAARIRPAAELVAARLADEAAAATGDARDILDTTAVMAADPSLVGGAEERVRERGLPAPRAVWESAAQFIEGLTAAGGYLAERAADLRDVRDRVVGELTGERPSALPELDAPSVLVARDLAPADAAALDPKRVLAVVTEEGGPTSHTAILARSLGIPAVVGATGALALDAEAVRVDGDTGTVQTALSTEVTVPERVAAPRWDGHGRTADGVRVPVLANIGSPQDAVDAAGSRAEGVGLFRTEFCYLAAESEPDVAEQRARYRGPLEAFHGKPVVVRTLDAGADKPLTFALPGAEPNPALGVRGIRVARQQEGLLERQLAAIVGAAEESGADVSVMAPMVATAAEARWFAERARAAGVRRVGVMVEVPAAALTAAEVLAEVDFVSLGTNDLAQYTMAADRGLGAVAALQDPWQPAVLRLVAAVGDAGAAAGKPVGVCGEAAADPVLACALVGLGVTSLSMNPVAVDAVGAKLAACTHDACRTAGRSAAAAADPASARTAATAALPS